jgi:hypothetical protein
VYDDFHTPTTSASPLTLRRCVIVRKDGAADQEIEAELGEHHTFTESEVSWIIAELIAKQPNGEQGHLDRSGKANLLYTPSFVVGVDWFFHDGRCFVDAWHRGDRRWYQGDSVFSRN